MRSIEQISRLQETSRESIELDQTCRIVAGSGSRSGRGEGAEAENLARNEYDSQSTKKDADASSLDLRKKLVKETELDKGVWEGKTAADHLADNGVSIGRPPSRNDRYGGSKMQATRMVDSEEELLDIFESLSADGKKVENEYPGDLYQLPDGVLIGLRTKARTSDYWTMEIWPSQETQLRQRCNGGGEFRRSGIKIHVDADKVHMKEDYA